MNLKKYKIKFEKTVMQYQNDLGAIAETYSKLQALQVLKKARENYPLAKASNESTLRSVFQSVEIALLNMSNLIARAAKDVECEKIGAAVVKMSWVRDFHHLLVRISVIPQLIKKSCPIS